MTSELLSYLKIYQTYFQHYTQDLHTDNVQGFCYWAFQRHHEKYPRIKYDKHTAFIKENLENKKLDKSIPYLKNIWTHIHHIRKGLNVNIDCLLPQSSAASKSCYLVLHIHQQKYTISYVMIIISNNCLSVLFSRLGQWACSLLKQECFAER